MSKKLIELAAEIIQAQASINTMSAEELETALKRTFNTLYKMQRAEDEGKGVEPGEKPQEAAAPEPQEMDPKESIKDNKVICMECGAEFRQLTANHLLTHGLSPRDYKKKWGFQLKQSLSARSLSKSRSRAAKKRGVPQELLNYQEEQRRKKREPMSGGGEMGSDRSPTQSRKKSAS